MIRSVNSIVLPLSPRLFRLSSHLQILTIFRYLSSDVPPWSQSQLSPSFWLDSAVQRRYLDWIVAKLGLTGPERLRKEDFISHGGAGLLAVFGGSPSTLVRAVLPEVNLEPWQFNSVRSGYWNNIENRKKYFAWLRQRLGLTTDDCSPTVPLASSFADSTLLPHKAAFQFKRRRWFPQILQWFSHPSPGGSRA